MVRLAEPHEPRTTVLLDPVIYQGLGRGVHAWVAEDLDGRVAALLVTFRICRDRWAATPLLFDEAAASAIARRIDLSPAGYVLGTAGNVGPVREHIRRAGSTLEMKFSSYRPDEKTLEQMTPTPPDPDTRLATPTDLDELMAAYKQYEYDFYPTEPRLRAHLRGALRSRRVVVIERDGRIAGAIRADSVSRNFIYWSGLTVLPEFRGQGLWWPLLWRGMTITAMSGLGISWTSHPSKPPLVMSARDDSSNPGLHTVSDDWLQVRLRPRIRGTGRFHRALERAEGRLERRTPTPLDPSRPSGRQSEEIRSQIGLDGLGAGREDGGG